MIGWCITSFGIGIVFAVVGQWLFDKLLNRATSEDRYFNACGDDCKIGRIPDKIEPQDAA